MLKLNPYINFLGKTEEAFKFYRTIFGGDFTALQRFKDVKEMEEKNKMSESDLKKIMHISLKIGDNTLMGTDFLESLGQTLVVGNNISLSIHADSRIEADRLFNSLKEDGKEELPMTDMFWGSYFGMVEDQYGIKWMIEFSNQEESE